MKQQNLEKHNWENITCFFEALNNANIEYVVLRNYEKMHEEDFFCDGHEDIDFLVSNVEKFKKIAFLEKREPYDDNIHFKVLIQQCYIDIDIRCLGDKYYDSTWARKMLDNRKICLNGNWYVLSDEDYYYSLVYHAYIQKQVFALEYKKRLDEMYAKMLFEKVDKNDHLENLSSFMKKNRYSFVRPSDIYVPWNIENLYKVEHIKINELYGEFRRFLDRLNSENICYAILNNREKIASDISIDGIGLRLIIKQNQKKEIETLLHSLEYKQYNIYASEIFLYDLVTPTYWRLETEQFSVCIEVFCQLSCKSLTDNMRIPMDRKIQEHLWISKLWDKENKWWTVSVDIQFIYYITYSIFDIKRFSEYCICELEKMIPYIDSVLVKELFAKIFFGYTDRLLLLIERKQYNRIREDYISFSEY